MTSRSCIGRPPPAPLLAAVFLAALALQALLLPALIPAGAEAQQGLPPYAEESDVLATTPGTDTGAAAAMLNPAQWGLLERSEFSAWWSDRQLGGHRRDDYGFSTGKGLGLSYRHRMAQNPGGPRGVSDYQLGIGWGTKADAVGIAYGFSGPGRSAFGRKNFFALGEIVRPARWLSFGSAGRLASGESQGLLDLGIRPLSDPRVLLFADYAIRNDQHWDDGSLGGGVAIRPIPGLEAAAKWSENDRFRLTLGVTLARTGFRALSGYAGGNLGATKYLVRLNPPVRGADVAGRLLEGRRFLEMNLKGRAVYQAYRFLDEESIPLRRILNEIQFAIDDRTVGGVALNLSGFEANVDMLWEVREKLLALRRAGKKTVVYCDRVGAAGYYLATAADQIVMDPRGMLTIPGVQFSRTYVKDALEKMGIGFEEWRYFKYKSAMEGFSRRDMSEADREQLGGLVKETYEELASGITASGRMTRAQLDATVNEEPYLSPRRLLELRWIDQIGGPDALRGAAKKVAGRDVRLCDRRRLPACRRQPDEEWGLPPTVALVYAVGDCAMDTGIRGRETSKALKKLRERRDVKAVVMRVDSPGGDPLPSDLVAREMQAYAKAKKPLYVSQGRVAASGGYWISMDAARIATSPFTITGSIGVIGGWAWNKGLGGKLGIASDRVQMGKSADLMGGLRIPIVGVQIPERNLDDRERELAKRSILELYDDFTGRVAKARGITVERVREIGEGRVYMGRAAMGLKLVDRVASLDEAIEEAKGAAGIGPGRRVRVEEHPKPKLLKLPGFLSWIGSRVAGDVLRAAAAGAAGVAASGEAASAAVSVESEPWTYEQRVLGLMLRNPGTPLLLTPASLLPDEPAAR